jgi:hypothetical protein
MIWTFPQNLGGQEDGFHNAGVETFKGNLERYLAREVIQNSLDARIDQKKPVLVRFQLEQLKSADIPDIAALKDTFKRCWKYWQTDDKALDFFQQAEKLAKAETIAALRIGDFNTTGVPGSDIDRAKGWYSLIRCSGSSPKGPGEGGSFGIGKYAPFAASRMRTVLYSTLNDEGKYAFQGVAKLVSHEHPRKGIAQATGYLGNADTSSIREKKKIPKKFLRAKKGTELVVLGYKADKLWNKELIYSILENFWPAIHFGALEAEVGGAAINKANLLDLLESYSAEEEFAAHHYYRAYTDAKRKTFSKNLPTLKQVEVRLFAGDPDLPKRVAMVRKTGMVIYHKRFQSIAPFCGVFTCRNKDGNDVLRQMEPPRHDEWDPDHPEKGVHKKTEAEFMDFIRGCVKQLAPADNAKILTLHELSQYLPDDDESDDEMFDDEPNTETEKESFDRKPDPQPIKGKKMDPKRPMQPDSITNSGGDSEASGDGEDDGDSGATDGTGDGGEERAVAGGTGSGHEGGASAKLAIPIQYRVFPQDLAKGMYVVTLKPVIGSFRRAMLTISAVGDDLTAIVAIEEARFLDGKKIDIAGSGVLGPVTIPKGQPLRIEITLSEPRRLAMEVKAHEA